MVQSGIARLTDQPVHPCVLITALLHSSKAITAQARASVTLKVLLSSLSCNTFYHTNQNICHQYLVDSLSNMNICNFQSYCSRWQCMLDC